MFQVTATQPIQTKFITFPSKSFPLPKCLLSLPMVLPFLFIGLQALKLLSYLWLISIPALMFTVTNFSCSFSLKVSFVYSFLLTHCFLLISISQFNSYIICARLSGSTHTMHHIYRGSSFPNHEVPYSLSHQLLTHRNSLHKMWNLMSCDLPHQFSYLFSSQHQPSQNFNPLSPSRVYHYFKDPNRHKHWIWAVLWPVLRELVLQLLLWCPGFDYH